MKQLEKTIKNIKPYFSIELTENQVLSYVILCNAIENSGLFSDKFIKECKGLQELLNTPSSKLIFKNEKEVKEYFLIFLALVEMFEIGRNWFPLKGGYINISIYQLVSKIFFLLEKKNETNL